MRNFSQFIIQTLWIALFLLYPFSSVVYSQKMIAHHQHYFYFPDKQQEMAQQLLKAELSMSNFLATYGLETKGPIHIILDEKMDKPMVDTYLLPHREIRIPLRAPGVFEEAYNEPSPWHYFLFKGLCVQSIYNERSGLPAAFSLLFGDLMTPNRVLPDWFFDSISQVLYEKYQKRTIATPLLSSIFKAGPLPELDKVSNHPEVWPGRYSYRIYGRPFVDWLINRFGWEKMYAILQLHGSGIIPIEIDYEAITVYGQSWSQLWQTFKQEHLITANPEPGKFIIGYWPDPFIYWNDMGIYPGPQTMRSNSRYGYVDAQGWLWTSASDREGVSRISRYRMGTQVTLPYKHIWDPGPGGVAITRKSDRPQLVIGLSSESKNDTDSPLTGAHNIQFIDAPMDVVQLSGPVADANGRVAVAGNTGGNWDIWVFDGQWHRMTNAPSIEIDPWIENDTLVFVSNTSGRFQIHNHDMRQLTHTTTAALLPRHTSYLSLTSSGWEMRPLYLELDSDDLSKLPQELPSPPSSPPEESPSEPDKDIVRPYSPLKSIWPNYIAPDLFIDDDDFQIGLYTESQDVSNRYGWDVGARYNFSDEDYSWRLGGRAHSIHARATRYPFSYITHRLTGVNEIRHDLKLGWSPSAIRALEVSVNWRHYEPVYMELSPDQQWWTGLSYNHKGNRWRLQTNLDLFDDSSQSLYGLALYQFGQRIHTIAQLCAGKTWGDPQIGHNTFRIGGNVSEGFFTHRPSRLFPIRGFDANILEAEQAAVVTLETFWPIAELHTGYKTLPLFLRNIKLSTFADAGYAAEPYTEEDLLVGAGFEIITGMEVAWGVMADIHLGIAWPVIRPNDFEDNEAILLIQIGRPL